MRAKFLLISAGTTLLLIALGLAIHPVTAAPPTQGQPQTGNPAPIENDSCLFCHAKDGMSVTLDNGETLPLTIDADAFGHSVHGANQLNCVTCHVEIKTFPHGERPGKTLRDVKQHYYTLCQQCHAEQFTQAMDGVHQRALEDGNKNAAVCTDCHNPHTQKTIAEMTRSEIPDICGACHSTIANEYRESVHGQALLNENNPDVPSCVDCHGVHNIVDPTTQEFRLKSPTEMCGKCHTNPAIMDKYGISTNVLNTYVADFHGTTVTLFEKQAPDQATNKPVCFDCHGVHNIAAADDPQKGLQVKTNLLKACQKCHPSATTETFTEAWLSHYVPSAEKYPIVYYVDLFYKFFIPAVLGPMAILVLMDFGRMMINRFKKPKHHPHVAPAPEPPPAPGKAEVVAAPDEPVSEAPDEVPPDVTEAEEAASEAPVEAPATQAEVEPAEAPAAQETVGAAEESPGTDESQNSAKSDEHTTTDEETRHD